MTAFAERVLDWYQLHGRHDLPWQKNTSLYRSWISEIMLQQTQVATVIPYFERFMQRFPDIKSLSRASLDDVLLHWAGLGYYTRARNIYKSALIIAHQHQGQFPTEYEDALALPGIGPSTAGAILAQALGQRHAILDGNVKRVLARYRTIDGWPGQKKVEQQLWQLAEKYTPQQDVADYTQAIMDLGATLCTRSSPGCEGCPLADDCMALAGECVSQYPAKKPKKSLPVKHKRFLIIRNPKGAYLMEKRPPSGIWGGLWSLPELAIEQPVENAVQDNWQLDVEEVKDLPVFRHSFSHFHLDITPCEIVAKNNAERVADDGNYQWCTEINQLALAAPVSVILNKLK